MDASYHSNSQSEQSQGLRDWDLLVPRGWDEVKTAVDTRVRDHLLPVDGHLLIEVLVKLLIDVLDDWHPTTGATPLITPSIYHTHGAHIHMDMHTHTHTICHC